MRWIVIAGMWLAMFAAPAAAVTNNDDDLGFFSGFWNEWSLTVRLDNCGPAMGRYTCQYRVMNEDGLQVGFGSNDEDAAVTNFLIMKQSDASELIFLVATASAIKAIAEDMSQEDREALSKELYKEAMAKGVAERSSEHWQVTLTKLSQTAWVAEGRSLQ